MTRPEVQYADTPKKARRFMDELYRTAYLNRLECSMDTEFDMKTQELALMSYSWGRGVRRVVEGPLVKEFFGDWLVDDQSRIVYQNLKADKEIMDEIGIDVIPSYYADIMITGWLRDETMMKHDLKTQSEHFLKWRRKPYSHLFAYIPDGKKTSITMTPQQVLYDLPPDALRYALKTPGVKSRKIQPTTEPRAKDEWIRLMLEYSGDDAESTAVLHYDHKRYLKKIGYWEEYLRVDKPYTLTLLAQAARGVLLDIPRLRVILRKMDIKIMRAERVFRAAAGNPKLNLRSGPQMQDLLIREWGWPVREDFKTPTGNPKLDAQAMHWWSDEGYELADVKLEFNNAATMKGTFLQGLINGVGDDGRLRSDFNQIGARTGRISSRKGTEEVEEEYTLKSGVVKTRTKKRKVGANLQNIPARKEKDPDGIRGAFIAPKKGQITAFDDIAEEDHVLIVCVVPETRILKADMTWEQAGKIKVGDKLVGFDEDLATENRQDKNGRTYLVRKKGKQGRGTKLRESIVESVKIIKKECHRIVTDRGTVISSDEHRWVGKKKSSRVSSHREWLRTDQIEPGDEIAMLCDPWDSDRSYDAGWLAGIYDGEGWIHRGGVGFGQNAGATLERVKKLLAEKGFPFSEKAQGSTPRMRTLDLNGERGSWRFLGAIRPQRLLSTFQAKSWQGTSTWGKSTKPARVLRVEPVYDQRGGRSRDVVAIKTSTRTYIAEGMLSHNCDYSGFELCMAIHWASKLVKDSPMLAIMQKYGSPSACHAFTAINMYADRKHRCDASCYEVDKKTKLVVMGPDGKPVFKKFHKEGLVIRLGKIKMDDWKMVKSIFPDEYSVSKNNNFNLLYGGSPKMMARLRGLDFRDEAVLDECREQANAWNELYWEIPIFQQYMVDHGRKKGWVPVLGGWRANVAQGLAGRDSTGKLIDDEDKRKRVIGHWERVCMNTPCQGSASWIVKVAQNGCERNKKLKELRCAQLFPVHDELVFEVPGSCAEEAKPIVIFEMKQPYKSQMAFEIDVEGMTGINWLQAKG